MIGLNFGCGPDVRGDWVNYDRDEYPHADVGDVLDGLPYADDSFDAIVANHVLQTFRYVELPIVIGELARVLKPGGTLRVIVPSPIKAFEAYERSDSAWFPIVDEAETSVDGKFCAYLTWYSEARTLFTEQWLVELLDAHVGRARATAFDATYFGPDGITDLDSPSPEHFAQRCRESIVVEGRKQ